jgi:RNA polymerase sigma-70 factor (ECF subfamily)
MTSYAEVGLVAGARAGDPIAFEDLLRPWITPAATFAFNMLHDRQEAEDAVQEAALKAWRKLDRLREGAPFGPWFLGIVANQCGTVRRGRWFHLVRHPSPDHLASWTETAADADLRAAIRGLNEGQRAAIVLHYYLDMPLDDVARVLKLSRAGVKSRLHRALRALRPLLDSEEVT